MRTVQWLLLAVLAAGATRAAERATEASLLLSADTVKPGETILAGIRLTMAKGWHTYWRNSGESGKATEIEWTLPPGVKAGPIQWPVPEKLTTDDLTTYVYHDETLLLVPLTVPADAAAGEREIVAKVSWLECQVSCVPGQATVRAKLRVGPQTTPSVAAVLLKTWQEQMPRPDPLLQARAWWENRAETNSRALLIEWQARHPGTQGDFFPYEDDRIEIAPKTAPEAASAGRIRLRKMVTKTAGDWPKEIAGLIIEKPADGKAVAYEARLPVAQMGASAEFSGGAPAGAPGPGAGAAGATQRSLWWMFCLAFLGGLILNVMPCVLPVIALKILGFVNQSRDDPRRVRRLGWIYGLGVLASFLVLAGVVIGVQAAGRQASWGMQFGNPEFIVVLTVLVTLVSLDLFGLFEVTLGSKALTTAAELAGREGQAGAFFNGMLATALATPCTAPFLGLALGFAFTQSPLIIVLMFLTVGAGLALPYVLLAMMPGLLRLLPKPGAWMEKFKIAMGFPMLGTAVWLFCLAQDYYGKRVWWLGVFLVIVALAAWIYGEFVQRGRKRRGLAGALLALLLAGGYLYALEGQLRWRAPVEADAPTALRESPEGIPWQPWSRAAVEKARAEGRPVFVDFTADWCVTCQANKKTSIEIPSVRARLQDIQAVALLGDYTRVPTNITAELRRFGRAGVPLVLVYPKDTSAPPIVLPELLTPSIVLNALQKAAQVSP